MQFNIKIEELLYAMYHFPLAITSPFISLYYFDLSGGDYLGSGFIISIPYLFLIFSSGFFGRLSDKLGSKNLVMFSLLIYTLSFISYYLIDKNPPIFFLAYIGFNIIISAYIPSFNRLVSFQKSNKRGKVFGKLGMWASAGFLCGSLLTTVLIDHLEYRILFLIAAAFAFCAFLIGTQVQDDFSSKAPFNYRILPTDSPTINPRNINEFLKPIMILLLLVVLTQITNSLYISFFAIFVEKELNQLRSMVALVNTIATALGIFGTYIVGKIIDMYAKKNLIITALFIYTLLPLCTYLLSNALNSVSINLIFVLYSIPLYSIFFVVVPVFISENSLEQRRGQAMGFYTSSQYLGMTLGTIIGSIFASVNGVVRPNFLLAALIGFISILIGIFLFKETSIKREERLLGEDFSSNSLKKSGELG